MQNDLEYMFSWRKEGGGENASRPLHGFRWNDPPTNSGRINLHIQGFHKPLGIE
jgi:hypothetical protein